MDNPMAINENAYAWASSASESDVTLTPENANSSMIIVDNQTSYPVAVTTGLTAATAAFPTSATVPVQCKVVAAGTCQSFKKPIGHSVVSLIQGTAEAGAYVYVYVGSGE